MSFSPAERCALRELTELWVDRKIALVGASALGCHIDMSWRKTSDLDLGVAVELDEYPAGLEVREGWTQDGKYEHRWISPAGVKLDILPAGPRLLEAGVLLWSSGHEMSLCGLDLALQHTRPAAIDNDFSIQVARAEVIALLKMTAYLDRPAERERDLADLAHLIDAYVSDDDLRRWDEAAGRDFESAPAYLLGVDIAAIALASHRAVLGRFLDRLGDQGNPEHFRMIELGPARWRSEQDPLARRIEAVRAGLVADSTG